MRGGVDSFEAPVLLYFTHSALTPSASIRSRRSAATLRRHATADFAVPDRVPYFPEVRVQ